MSTPHEFATRGVTLLTQWAQITEQLMTYAPVYEARGGGNIFEDAKIEPEEGQQLTPEDVAYNESLDEAAAAALDVVVHHNELVEWYNATRRQRVNIRRVDY